MPGWRFRLLGLVLCLPLLAGGCASQRSTDGTPASASQDAPATVETAFHRLPAQPYTPPDWPEALSARVYLPDTPGDTKRPAALVVHGGGWQRRGPEDMAPIAERLAAHGFVVANIAYRFAPEYRFPAQLHDLQVAMAWLHDHADDWRIDTERIVGVGYSSGAHLVSLLGMQHAGSPLDRPYGGEDTRLAAVVAGGLPSDLLKFDDGRLVVEFIGGTRAEKPRAYRLASPARQVTENAPPHFLFHGNLDSLVPVDHATDMYARLAEAGVPAELYLQRLRGHITAFLTRDGAMEAALSFLDEQLASLEKEE
ncbi:alpha/beta hydrolase [Halomonas organivorans]|uniref:Acetyl esterase/lipase n=1 Tax=Halomonas organivorans TaxID=257772 RepID=A0A7W5G5V6_9GAMM|nr:alpha/beta hydrolase [Halomonas organivorans]MBB3140796.1 acetyl esterase/lipase [Halomonas organivorans]